MNIGDRLKNLRKDRGISQTAFANSLGISQDSVSLWENNKRIPDTPYIIKICKEYNISADYLLGLTTDESKYI